MGSDNYRETMVQASAMNDEDSSEGGDDDSVKTLTDYGGDTYQIIT